MKVLLLSPLPPPAGGISSWTKRVLEIGLPGNWEVDNINTQLIGKREVFGNTKRKLFDEIKRNLKITKKLKKKLKESEYSLIHSSFPCTKGGILREFLCARIAKRYGVPYILHCRCTVPNIIKGRLHFFMFKKYLKLCKGIIVLNKQSAQFMKNKFDRDCVVIPNFIEEVKIFKGKKEINPSIQTAVYIGGVIREKGCASIIESAKNFPNILFLLVGNPSEEIKNMQKTKNVQLIGEKTRDEVDKILRESDLFLFPGNFIGEGFSNALTEAMAAGLPCIASDWAANKDMLENLGGVIIEPQNANQLVDAISYMQEEHIRKRMSKWNIDKVVNSYTDSIVLKKYTDYYATVLDSGKL